MLPVVRAGIKVWKDGNLAAFYQPAQSIVLEPVYSILSQLSINFKIHIARFFQHHNALDANRCLS